MKKICLLSVFIFSNLFSEFNISYMLKYADGENSDTDIFENYVDVFGSIPKLFLVLEDIFP